MGQIAGTTFGIGTPTTYPLPPVSWGLAPYTGYTSQGFATQPLAQQPYVQPIAGTWGAAPPLQQLQQLLQLVPQQLQQLQVLQYHQLQQLQQLLQLVPAQLQQLQQLVQVVPQQVQQLQQQWQPFGQALSGPLGFGLVPQAFAGPAASHIM